MFSAFDAAFAHESVLVIVDEVVELLFEPGVLREKAISSAGSVRSEGAAGGASSCGGPIRG
ncbi:MAG: hypothetical protein O3C25_01545 [Chloroflexi bacterium]|nr:hypothetical protein [Chloroflexota bacterium]